MAFGEPDKAKRARIILAVSVGVTALLYAVPHGYWVAYPLVLLSTFAHEMGHGLSGVLVGAHFDSFHLYADASGVAMVAGNLGRFAQATVSAGGLLGPSVFAALLFVASVRPGRARVGLGLFGLLMLIACVLVVRNLFGLVFVGSVGAVATLLAWKAPALASQGTVAFLATQLALSVFSRGDYLFTDVAQTANGSSPSDVAQMSKALFLPYWFWGGLCGLISVVVLGLGLWMFWIATRSQE